MPVTQPRTLRQQIHSSYRWTQLAASFKKTCAKYDLPCHICKQPIDYHAKRGDPNRFEADHYQPLSRRPDLAYTVSNLRPSHASCNNSKNDTIPVDGPWVTADW